MIKIDKKQQQILSIFLEHDAVSSSKVHEFFVEKYEEKTSLVTIKRELARITRAGFINAVGNGRARIYHISTRGRISADVDAHSYCSVEPDQRHGLERFNFELLPSLPSDLFTAREHTELENATQTYHQRTANLPPAIAKKELERLIIELSWKSSKIEGNTYTLLDTEKLILEHKAAPGHDKKEMIMILNHKDAFNFIHDHPKDFAALTHANLEELHKLIVKNLNVGTGLRKKPVGVTGSIYQPLDNEHQIKEAIDQLSTAITRMKTPYEKALTALAGLSYVQPFEDGNKRTARLMANALLWAYACAPLSYRSVEENTYREATLVFYELNSIIPFKEIFMSQYIFAAHQYAVI
ncbi:MAG: Uncharacterized protein G01um101470_279 [Parcubacteria group bacterium Gr01-1014_70]|nr:MAG: Uncharacterized protein G01um101470_279 [Parcubacteria group bacterium Gr01-1014_70]